MDIIPKTNKTWRAFCPSMVVNRTRIILLLQRNVPAKYVKDREGLDRLIELSVGKFVRKDNLYIERPPRQSDNKSWVIHMSMFELEVQGIEKIVLSNPNVLNLMCTKIQFRRNRSKQAENERSIDERDITGKDSTTEDDTVKKVDALSSSPHA